MVQPRKVNGSKKNKVAAHVEPTDAAPKAKNGSGNKKMNHQGKNHHGPTKMGRKDNYYNPAAERMAGSSMIHNPNLSKKDIKMIEKIEAKIEYHEIRDEHEEVDKLREKLVAIEENANGKALKKAEKMQVGASMA